MRPTRQSLRLKGVQIETPPLYSNTRKPRSRSLPSQKRNPEVKQYHSSGAKSSVLGIRTQLFRNPIGISAKPVKTGGQSSTIDRELDSYSNLVNVESNHTNTMSSNLKKNNAETTIKQL